MISDQLACIVCRSVSISYVDFMYELISRELRLPDPGLQWQSGHESTFPLWPALVVLQFSCL